MTDPVLVGIWVAVLFAGLGVTVLAHRLGLSTAHARDLLHVGAGVWVLGWPRWGGAAVPLLLAAVAAGAVALVPVLAGRFEAADRFRRTVASGDESFGGLVVYAMAFAVLTGPGVAGDPFPAGAALWTLALGDGLGGVVGRRLGRRIYRVPWGKRKSLEGSAAVAVFGCVGVAAAGLWFGAGIGVWQVVALGVVAAVAEGLAPRGMDNAVVPAAVWAAALPV